MVDTGSYSIIDEPRPSRLRRFAANPFWVILSGMVLVQLQPLSLLWFGFNGIALGSPTRRRELVWIVAGLLVVAGFEALLSPRLAPALLSWTTIELYLPYLPYLSILRTAAVLAVLTRLYLFQIGPYHRHRYLAALPT